MSLSHRLLAGTALALAGLTPAAAQSVSVGGDVQVWYTQMLDSNLRNNAVANYYNLRDEFKENGFTIRRAEIKLSGKIVDEVEYEVMFDPSIKTDPAKEPMILQDAFIKYAIVPGLEFKVGQFKTLQTMEGNISSTELLFAERSQLGRAFGDKRDRGAVLSYAFGDPKEFGAKFSVGAVNGMTDSPAKGKVGDANAQKDLIARLDMNVGKEHKFGVYTLQGSTDQKDTTGISIAANPGGLWPTQQDIYDNKDKTSNLGAFYEFQNESWIANAEYITGLLGRRAATLGVGNTPKREHLDQKFTGYYVTAGYKMGAHTILARYDMLNYNSGDQWYTATSPYITPGVTDYSPKFTEITVGYTYAFKPEKVKAANIKVNYINRSKNFLKPNAAALQTKEQGGDTLMVGLQVAF
jgi:hypothetical protein